MHIVNAAAILTLSYAQITAAIASVYSLQWYLTCNCSVAR
ncbi:hypothetical protein FORC31_p281 (plasmid) [Escherichia coli]|nr:hypothetical protein FORC31_p281 [Escherichia coli]